MSMYLRYVFYVQYDRNFIQKYIECLKNRIGLPLEVSNLDEIEEYKGLNFSIHLSRPEEKISKLTVGIEEFYFQPTNKNYKKNCKAMMELIKYIWDCWEPGCLFAGGAFTNDSPLPSQEQIKKNQPVNFTPVIIFGSVYKNKIGEENLLNAPVYKIEKLKNGIMLILNKDPLDLTNEEELEKYLKRFLK